jgi:hypothetical protein
VLEHLLDLTTIKLLGARIMADSENSRTLPSISYRNLPWPAERMLQTVAMEQAASDNCGGDKTLVRWQAWWRSHLELSRHGQILQRLEAELFRTAARATTDISKRAGLESIIASAPDEDELQGLYGGEMPVDPGNTAVVEPAMHVRGRDGVDEPIGYRGAKAAEEVAAAVEQKLSDELCSEPAGSALAAAAKLHCIISHGEPGPNHEEFPWPQLRSTLADLLMISAAKPAACQNN